ncbi:MAG: diaminopimelate decarboxylase, partial [Candidatus Altiarchaeales archaeon]|nr:diaminopimelate decarboxylase [Candidatus Altiarchaeales archaeon]
MDPELLIKIAREYGTPVYVYDEGLIRRNYREFYLAFKSRYRDVKVFYAYKANSNLAICHILKEEGAKADVVSGGELKVALKVGLNPRDIIFTNNSKTRQELELAVDSGVVINVDSRDELYRIHEIAEERDKPASVSFRVNPSIDPRTHPKIATGLRESKFGIHLEGDLALNTYRVAMELDNIEVSGVHTHIGSQITCSGVFRDAAEKIMEFVYELHEKLGLKLKFVDLGGGLGINYRGDEKTITPDELAGEIITVMDKWNEKLGYGPELWLEPGRYLVGNAGVLLCEVQGVKETPCRKFINVDAGFTTLARPVLYDAYHRVG